MVQVLLRIKKNCKRETNTKKNTPFTKKNHILFVYYLIPFLTKLKRHACDHDKGLKQATRIRQHQFVWDVPHADAKANEKNNENIRAWPSHRQDFKEVGTYCSENKKGARVFLGRRNKKEIA